MVFRLCLRDDYLRLVRFAHQKTGEDFLLGGRSLPMILTLGSTVGTMVGTGSSVGAVGFGYSNGWAGMLYGLGGAVGDSAGGMVICAGT